MVEDKFEKAFKTIEGLPSINVDHKLLLDFVYNFDKDLVKEFIEEKGFKVLKTNYLTEKLAVEQFMYDSGLE